MMPASKIATVAFYEAKVLTRSWFFRIFAGISVAFLVAINAVLFTGSPLSPWVLRAIPANLPYLNILLLNLVQTIIALFLSTGFLKRDMVLDTTEVVYIRSLTNEAYVIGKALGNGIVFFGLNLAVLIISLTFNTFAPDVPVRLLPYIYYPLLISLPTLTFTFGAAFLLMATIRNQPVVLVVLLGGLGLGFFFLPNALYGLFDVTGLSLPFMYSDFTGFGDAWVILQRAMYLLAGSGCILLTALFLKRLPQSMAARRASTVGGIFLCVIGLGCGIVYAGGRFSQSRMRQEMVVAGNRAFDEPKPTPVSYRLELQHRGSTISGSARIVLRNDTPEPMPTYVFRLNPGLNVRGVRAVGGARFTRDVHLVRVTPAAPLQPGAGDTLVIDYAGTVLSAAGYLDMRESEMRRASTILLFRRFTAGAFVTPSYVLLTPETQFYPMVGAGFSSEHPEHEWRALSAFEVNVTTRPGLTAISQGAAREEAPGSWTFRPETPLPGVSLIIGRYALNSVTVDSVEYHLLTLPSHKFFVPYFSEINDTLGALIREIRGDYESDISMRYPYSRLLLIEVPIQFAPYQRLWTQTNECVQPEAVLLPENGATLTEADFKRPPFRFDRRRSEDDEVLTPQEEQISRLRRFVNRTLIAGAQGNLFRGMPDELTPPLLRRASIPGASYSVFAQFYRFVTVINSHQWPLVPIAMEAYYRDRPNQGGGRDPFRRMFNISRVERVNLALSEKGLAGMLKDNEHRGLADDAIGSLATWLFTRLKKEIGPESFDSLMQEVLDAHRFGVMDVRELCDTVLSRYRFDAAPVFAACYGQRRLPGYAVDNLEAYEFSDTMATRYQVLFDIRNCDSADGLAAISVRGGGRGGRGGGGGGGMLGGAAAREYIVSLDPLQSKRVGIVLERPPRMMMVNTLLSRNVPSVLTFNFDRLKPRANVQAFQGDSAIQTETERDTGTLIVDNEDPGFGIENRAAGGLLQRLFVRSRAAGASRYADMRMFQPPAQWTPTAGPFYYGTFVRSACFVKGGDGSQKISWSADIPEEGTYEVYTYVSGQQRRFRGRGREQARQDQGEYEYVVHHEGSAEAVALKLGEAQDGWNLLGTYFFPKGKTRVELSNKSSQRVVVGDAVKWVKD